MGRVVRKSVTYDLSNVVTLRQVYRIYKALP